MSLFELTDRGAVLAALAEYDSLGREAFLGKYGFGPARDYFVEENGKLYDSKAVAGAAHGHQHGTPLRSSEFSGGDSTVAARLEHLGFVVTRPGGGRWRMPVGAIATRRGINKDYGGALYGGIQPSRTSPNILIFTDPVEGALNGYNYDGWDAHDDNVFYYTGEGRHGDQVLTKGNKAVAEHADTGRTLRLFEALDEEQLPGGKRHRYLGAFRIDDAAPYRHEPAPDAAGEPRQVLVFRLVREDATPKPVAPAPPVPAARVREESTPPPPGPDQSSATPWADPDDEVAAEVSVVASEQNSVTEFEQSPRTGTIAVRDEAKLVTHFESWLRGRGHEVGRVRITVPGERHTLVTDSYDVTTGTLYEAKSGVDRATIRLGVGQVLDYLRFLPGAAGALLLPAEPSADLRAFLRACGLGLAYRELGSWHVTDVALNPAAVVTAAED